MNAAQLLEGLLAAGTAGDARFHGVVIGIVSNNRDPEGLHRVKLHFPWLSDDDESHWARVATPMAGNGRGLYALPEVDDEVLVAFEHGSLEHPYVLGALWNGRDTPPENNGNGQNDHRSFTSRSGHVVRLNDTQGSETVEIIDKSGKNRIVIDTTGRSIRIEADGDIELSSTTGRVKISGIGIDLNAQADVTIQGAMVKVNS